MSKQEVILCKNLELSLGQVFISTKSENHVKNGYFHHNFKVLQ